MKKKLLYSGAAIAVVAASALMLTASQSQSPAKYDPAIETQTTIADGFTFASVGDITMPLPMAKWGDPSFQEALKPVKAADVAYANLEGSLIDWDDFHGPWNVGANRYGIPDTAADLKEMGFDALGHANNHGFDYGVEGMLMTNDILEKAGMLYMGSGKNYGAAWAPRYLMTPKGRVAFVAVTTTMWAQLPSLAGAKQESGEAPGRPGVAQLNVTQSFLVPRSMAPMLESMKKAFPTGGGLYAPVDPNPTQQVTVMEKKFKYGDVTEPRFTYEANKTDVAAALKSVREGKLKADFLSFGIHSHENATPEKPDTDPIPGDFMQGFAHQVIDAGADQFVGTGVHVLKPIEIYKGHAIFYGLGEFFRMQDTSRAGADLPARSDTNSDPIKYEAVVAVTRYEGGKLAEVKLYPVWLNEADRIALRGAPHAAPPEIAQRMLKRLQDLSAPYGTKINIVDNIGYITLQGAPPSPASAKPAKKKA